MRLALLALTLLATTAHAQWQLQATHTTADLRGIDNVGHGIAWASGTDGTILRTLDTGEHWQLCSKPPNAEHLDFRAIQAFDNSTAIIMSAGKGDLSRLYKTTDGCQSWHLLFTNPDKDGFWDALRMQLQPAASVSVGAKHVGVVIGDPVDGKFAEFYTEDNGEHWARQTGGEAGVPSAREGEALFAASNSSLVIGLGGGELFVTGGNAGSRSRVLSEFVKHDPRVSWKYVGGPIPLSRSESAGAFSVALAASGDETANTPLNDKWTLLYAPRGVYVVVGGDYKEPNSEKGTAAFSVDSGLHWTAPATQPHGFRSAVAYDAPTKTWITVGPNGTDISTDDGRNWHALHPDPAFNEPPDADQHWNALSLPYAVGPHGRIATLRSTALTSRN